MKSPLFLLVFASLNLVVLATLNTSVHAGPYSTALENDPLLNPNAPDAGIPGFVGVDGDGEVTDNNVVNPVFKQWASGYVTYDPYDLESIQNYVNGMFANPNKTLGPVTGNNGDIASLGDLNADQLAAWRADPDNNHGPGYITLTFDHGITNGEGADFAVFENGFISGGGAGVAGQIFAELGYVEVSSDGVNFARFPSVSLTEGLVGGYGTIDPTDVYNLAGKHVNAYGSCWGTPFDLDDLANHTLVSDGLLNLDAVSYVRIVDIPGDGSFMDDATALIDPTTGLPYGETHGIYDAWVTWGSGGVDLEAVGVINMVPEPATLTLLAAAAVAARIYFSRRRRGRPESPR